MARREGRPALRFGVFELDVESGDLLKSGRSLPLPPQPTRVLALLASSPGQLVTRDEIRRHIWGDAFVDADAGLNTCIREIRTILGDRAEAPVYIETVPRKGYRFVAPVERLEAPEGAPARVPAATRSEADTTWHLSRPAVLFSLVLVGLAAVSLGAFGFRRPVEGPAVSPEAREAYLEGQYLLERRTAGSVERSLEHFRRAVALDSDYVEAWLGLGNALLMRGAPPHERMPAARDAFARALRLDSDSAEAHLGLARVATSYDWDLPAALDNLEQARHLGLDTAAVYQEEAIVHFLSGRSDRAVELLEQALLSDPVSARLLGDVGWIYQLFGDFETSIEQCQRALELEPEHTGSLGCLRSAYRMLGRNDDALRSVLRLLELQEASPEIIAELAALPPAEALERYDRLRVEYSVERRETKYVASCAMGILRAQAGDVAPALNHLEQAFEDRNAFMLFLELDHNLEILRDEPRYVALASKVRSEIRSAG